MNSFEIKSFDSPLDYLAFTTQVIYNLIPITFIYQLKYGVINLERTSIFGIFCLYFNAFIYFWTSIKFPQKKDEINPLDFCNLLGIILGFFYIFIYYYYLYWEINKEKFLIIFCFLIIISLLVFLIIFNINKKENFLFYLFNYLIGLIFNIFENFPLGFSILYIIRNKISEKYTLFGATCGIVNTFVWLIWAIKHKLFYSIIANVISICLHLFQFFLFFNFKINKENNENVNNNNIEDNPNLELNEIRDDFSTNYTNSEINTEEDYPEISLIDEFI